MRTAVDVFERAPAAFLRARLVRKADGRVRRYESAFLLTTRATTPSAVPERSQVLASNLACLPNGKREHPRSPAFAADRTLHVLVADLVAARMASCMTQEEVAARMWTTKSVVSRLESGVRTRPTLSTLERYALAVGVLVEIRVRTRR